MSWQLVFGTPEQATLWGLNVVVHATVLAAISLLISLLLRRSAAMRYWVLCFGLALVSVSPATSALIQATGSSWVRISAVPELRSAASTLKSEIQILPERENQPNEVDQRVIETQTVRNPNAHNDLDHLKDADRERLSLPVPEQTSSVPLSNWLRASIRWLMAPLLFIWLAGAVIHLIRMFFAWVRLSRILRTAKPISNEQLKIEFDRACSIVGCRRDRRPQLVTSNAVSGPIAAGILYGKVVLPESLIQQVEPESLANVLVHEVAHVVRRDHIVVLLQNIVSAIYWPHPLVRILNCELAKAREEVCDNFVLVTTEAPAYSRTLLSLAQLFQHSCVIPGSVGFFTDRWKLEHRIAGLLDNHRNRSTILKKRSWLLLFATFTLLVGLTCVGTITIASSQMIQDLAEGEDGSSLPTIENANLRFTGKVVNKNGEPIEGAEIRWSSASLDQPGTLSEILALSAKDGTFSFERPMPTINDLQLRESMKWASLVASKNGYGVSAVAAPLAESTGQLLALFSQEMRRDWLEETGIGKPVVLIMPTDRNRVRGRILNMEGQAVVGAEVTVVTIREGAMGTLDAWKEETKRPGANYYSARSKLRIVTRRLLGDVPQSTALKTFRTDSEGNFELFGLGDDRIAELIVSHDSIETSLIHVRSEEGEKISLYSDSNGRLTDMQIYYPNRFTFVAGATRPVVGRLLDHETGQPVVGVMVEAYRTQRHLGGSMTPRGIHSLSDSDGSFRLIGIPIGENEISILPSAGSPYLAGGISVKTSLQSNAVNVEVKMRKGIIQRGRVIEHGTDAVVPGYLEYWPMRDNAAIAKTPMLEVDHLPSRHVVDAEGNFAIPVLSGRGILTFRANDDQRYQRGVGVTEITWPTVPDFDGMYDTIPSLLLPRDYHFLAPIKLAQGELPQPLTIRLVAGASIPIDVVGADGNRVTENYFAGERPLGGWRGPTSDSLLVEGYDPKVGRKVMVYHPASNSVAAIILKGEVQEKLQMQLVPSGRVIGRVLDDAGQPLQNARIRSGSKNYKARDDIESELWEFPDKIDGKPLLTDKDGRFFIEGLLPGKKYSASVDERSSPLNRTLGDLFLDLTVEGGKTKDLGDLVPIQAKPKKP